jgi:fermentation-respiration switch protein FrsA (DUF1100 family)
MVLIILAVAVPAALLLYVLLCSILYRRVVLPDRRGWKDDFQFTPWEFQADYEEIDLVTVDGTAFNAWFFRQPGTPQVVVVSPGHKGRRQDLLGISVALWRKGFNVLAYSYRGMAGSEGELITMGVHEVQELEAAIAFARSRVRNARIGLLGYSMGAAVSLLGAAGDPGVAALVLDSPFADARQVVRENVWHAAHVPGGPFVAGVTLWLRLWHGVRYADASPRAVLSGLEPRPLFFIHGGADEIVSVRHSRSLYDAYKGPREIWVVQGAPHVGAYFADRPLYVERVAGFFGRTLGLKSGHLRLVTEDEEEVS